MDAPSTKFHHVAPLGRSHHPRRFGSNQRLQVDLIYHESFHQLGLGQGCDYFQNWFVAKHRSALWHRKNVAGKTKISQPIQKFVGKFP